MRVLQGAPAVYCAVYKLVDWFCRIQSGAWVNRAKLANSVAFPFIRNASSKWMQLTLICYPVFYLIIYRCRLTVRIWVEYRLNAGLPQALKVKRFSVTWIKIHCPSRSRFRQSQPAHRFLVRQVCCIRRIPRRFVSLCTCTIRVYSKFWIRNRCFWWPSFRPICQTDLTLILLTRGRNHPCAGTWRWVWMG